MLHLVETQRVYAPETIAAMTAAFDHLCKSIPKSVSGDDLRRQLALISFDMLTAECKKAAASHIGRQWEDLWRFRGDAFPSLSSGEA